MPTDPATASPRPDAPRRAAALLLALVLSSGCRTMVAAPEGERLLDLHAAVESAEALPAAFDVVVWNIEKTRKRAWQLEFEELDRSAELVLIQEGYESGAFSEVIEASENEWRMAVSFHYVKDRGAKKVPTGVVTVAAARSISAVVQHSPTREPLTSTPKAALLTEYALAGREVRLLVVNVHAINFRRPGHLARQLEPLRAPIADHDGPVILAGDFNTRDRARLEALETFAAELGLTAVFPNWTTDASGRRRLAKDARTRHAGYPLDHVYVRGLTVSEARIDGASKGSDHAPMCFHVTGTAAR